MDPQLSGRLDPVPAMAPQGVCQEDGLHVFQRNGLHVRSLRCLQGRDAQEIGQVAGFEKAGLAEDEGPLHNVFQFPDIARVVVGHETGQGLVADTGNRLLLEGVEVGDEVFQQEREILHPFPQGRQAEGHHVDPVVEVFPKPALPDQVGQVAVGGTDDPYIRLQGFNGSQGLVGPLLEDPQETHLHGGGDVADLVEKQDAPFRQLETPRFVPFGVREGPGLVPEEFRLEEGIGQGTAVDGDKRPVLPGTQVVDGTGEKFLARAAFPFDEDRAVALGTSGRIWKHSCIRGFLERTSSKE